MKSIIEISLWGGGQRISAVHPKKMRDLEKKSPSYFDAEFEALSNGED